MFLDCVLCVYLDLHALLQQSLGLVLHLQPGSADQQQVVLNHLNAAQIHTLWQVVWSMSKQANIQKKKKPLIITFSIFIHVHQDANIQYSNPFWTKDWYYYKRERQKQRIDGFM